MNGDATARRALAEHRARLAREGENAAAAHLESRGYSILARNLRVGRNEIDILAVDPETRAVVLVEVKCRHGPAHRPEDRVDFAKRRGLSAAAERLAQRRDLRGARFRFDVIAVESVRAGSRGRGEPVVCHWKSAFDGMGGA